jgi:Fe-S-cluster containining protein
VSEDVIEESALCLACGLCCTGALHRAVEVKPEHVTLVRSLGLAVEEVEVNGKQAFRQPCPLYLADSCSVYDRRPPSCREFRCALLRKYADGRVDLETAIALAREARSLIDQGAARPLAPHETGPEAMLRAATLDVLVKRHFRE